LLKKVSFRNFLKQLINFITSLPCCRRQPGTHSKQALAPLFAFACTFGASLASPKAKRDAPYLSSPSAMHEIRCIAEGEANSISRVPKPSREA
jgi:hypothetical protein